MTTIRPLLFLALLTSAVHAQVPGQSYLCAVEITRPVFNGTHNTIQIGYVTHYVNDRYARTIAFDLEGEHIEQPWSNIGTLDFDIAAHTGVIHITLDIIFADNFEGPL